MFWKVIKLGLSWMGCLFLLMSCFFCGIVFAVTMTMTPVETKPSDINGIAKMMYRDSPELVRQTQDYHGEFPGFEGYDYTTRCNDILYSPLPGRGIVTFNGKDGYVGEYASPGEENTMLVVEGSAGKVILFHGTYDRVSVGDIVIGGITPVGFNDNVGNATGCHSHIVWKPNEEYIAENYVDKGHIEHTGKNGSYGSVLTNYTDVSLVISSYDPAKGGINCDGECETMASGDKVSAWVLAPGGIVVAACPQEWYFGTQFEIEGQVYECRDRGGFINCYKAGDYDPALTRLYKYEYYAESEYCWVDILGDSGYTFGSQVDTWSFTN